MFFCRFHPFDNVVIHATKEVLWSYIDVTEVTLQLVLVEGLELYSFQLQARQYDAVRVNEHFGLFFACGGEVVKRLTFDLSVMSRYESVFDRE